MSPREREPVRVSAGAAAAVAPLVEPLFAVPLATTRLADCAALNAELESLFLARETEEWRNRAPTHRPQRELFESAFDVFQWPEPCIGRLRAFVLESVGRTVAQLNGLPPERLARLAIHNHTWFHVTRRGGSFVAHNHPMASWSAVYCVRPGERVPERPDSGLLRFFDPRGATEMYQDVANASVAAPYRVGAVDLRLEAGQCVVFPSYLAHEVTPFWGADTRITVAANCWFTER